MLPIIPLVPPLEYGPFTIRSGYNHYDFIQDNTSKPPLRITINDVISVKGRGSSNNQLCIIHQIRRRIKTGVSPLQFMVISLDRSIKFVIKSISLASIISFALQLRMN